VTLRGDFLLSHRAQRWVLHGELADCIGIGSLAGDSESKFRAVLLIISTDGI